MTLLNARLDRARQLLEQIADRCGLGTAANLRIHFRRALAGNPTTYRHTFSQR